MMQCSSLEALEVGQELGIIPELFLQHSDRCFWVAEMLERSEAGELDALMNKMKKVGMFGTLLL